MTSAEYEREVRVMAAHHEVYLRQQAQILLLGVLLRLARGGPVSLGERWRAADVVRRYPEFEYLVAGAFPVDRQVV